MNINLHGAEFCCHAMSILLKFISLSRNKTAVAVHSRPAFGLAVYLKILVVDMQDKEAWQRPHLTRPAR